MGQTKSKYVDMTDLENRAIRERVKKHYSDGEELYLADLTCDNLSQLFNGKDVNGIDLTDLYVQNVFNFRGMFQDATGFDDNSINAILRWDLTTDPFYVEGMFAGVDLSPDMKIKLVQKFENAQDVDKIFKRSYHYWELNPPILTVDK